MIDEYKKYNSLKEWFDRNSRFNAYLDWNDDMAIPRIGDTDSDNDVIFIRNSREVCSRGRYQMNKNRFTCDNIFMIGGR
ncbi:hypothetical protein R3W88_033979 [Solanum pinnatisectum]|uniref:Uncharacterized protein n=1 Tax=Solanum pinnatisectum TaxID=50273 RepID=A0AAV9JZX8_9SOLN|nr:hypothetical protein R3W88_033979 [Solanum pinnatisectum]